VRCFLRPQAWFFVVAPACLLGGCNPDCDAICETSKIGDTEVTLCSSDRISIYPEENVDDAVDQQMTLDATPGLWVFTSLPADASQRFVIRFPQQLPVRTPNDAGCCRVTAPAPNEDYTAVQVFDGAGVLVLEVQLGGIEYEGYHTKIGESVGQCHTPEGSESSTTQDREEVVFDFEEPVSASAGQTVTGRIQGRDYFGAVIADAPNHRRLLSLMPD
jgi:hypothetical protein